MRGHLQCRDTLAGNEGCPLKTGTTVIETYLACHIQHLISVIVYVMILIPSRVINYILIQIFVWQIRVFNIYFIGHSKMPRTCCP